jgi:hypothetical protein
VVHFLIVDGVKVLVERGLLCGGQILPKPKQMLLLVSAQFVLKLKKIHSERITEKLLNVSKSKWQKINVNKM